MKTSKEKREQTRYEGVYAEYTLIKDEEGSDRVEFKAGFIRNFGLGGSSLQVFDNIAKDTLVLLHLYDPNVNAPIEILSDLVWKSLKTEWPAKNRDKYNIGIKHLYMDKDNESRLNRMIEYFEALRLKPKSSGIIEYF